MSNKNKFIIIILSLFAISAIKPFYGGHVKIRLNEPSDFSVSSTSYSDMVFYSLIYENFFYLIRKGNKYSNIFNEYKYNNKKLTLKLKQNIRFSNGVSISSKDIIRSLNNFIKTKSADAKRLSKVINKVYIDNGKIIILLNYEYPNIIDLISVPQLVLTSENQGVFSGPFYPTKWVKGKNIFLKQNKYYSGGIAYLDSIQIDFENYFYPDIFLSKPGTDTNGSHKEFNSGVYQNYYISFPKGKIGKNTRIAFYSIFKNFFSSQGLSELNVLTSDEESPLAINIRKYSKRKIRTILRYSNIKLYVLSTLKNLESDINTFFKKYRLNIYTVFVRYRNLLKLMNDTNVKLLITEKVFHKGTSLSEKIEDIVKEMSFKRFNENYFSLMEQLDEIKKFSNNELLMDHIAGIVQKIISDGYLLPLSQRKYSLYLRKNINNIIIDYYGRPLLHMGNYEYPLTNSKEKNNEN